jgi:hypothetical protein
MAVKYATYLYDHLPNTQGLCLADMFTKSIMPCHRFEDVHVWGSLMYIRAPTLLAGQKLSCWQHQSRQGLLYSGEIPMFPNLDTGSFIL